MTLKSYIKQREKKFDNEFLFNGDDSAVQFANQLNIIQDTTNLKAFHSQTLKEVVERIIEWLDVKEIGKGKEQFFDDGAYYENRSIVKQLKKLLNELK